MPKRITPLTDVQVKNAKPQEKEYSIFDGGGLYLLIGNRSMIKREAIAGIKALAA